MTFLTSFDELINEKSLLTHYFYKQKWMEGELTKEDLALYTKEYFHLVKAIPGMVASVRERAIERGSDLVSSIDENIKEETEHIDLWKRFAKSLDISTEELEAHEPHQLVKSAVSTLEELADGSLEDGVAMMYAMELTLPDVAKTKKEGLCKHYNLTSEDAHCYFDEHLNEEGHFKVWRQIPIDAESAKLVTEKSLAAQHQLLDGVCEVCGIEQPSCCMS